MELSRRRLLALGWAGVALGLAGCATGGGLTAPGWVPGGDRAAGGAAWRIPPGCGQLVLGLAPGWDATSLVLRRFERLPGGPWRAVGGPVPTRLGPGGLVWGNGLNPNPPGVPTKREGDGKTPVGVFPLGPVYGYAPGCQLRPGMGYTQIREGDLWVSDPRDPRYNQFVRLGRSPRTEWEMKERMRQNDYPHSLKMLIGHNTGARRRPGAGSAIFFHIWRNDGGRATAGCTAMPEPALRELIGWTDPARQPLYVLLPQSEYQRLRRPWGLP